MVFFRAKLRNFAKGLSFVEQELFLVDTLRLYRLDPTVYLPFWFSVIGFIIFFYLAGLETFSFWMLVFLVISFLSISVTYLFYWRAFVARWFKD